MQEEFEAYLKCGRLEHGFLRVRCADCHAEKLVAFSHGGEVETSLMLHLKPELVRRSELADFRGLPHELAARNRLLGAEKPIGIGWLSRDLHEAGVVGNAARADAQRGAKHLAYLAERFAALLGEVAATPLSILR